MFPNTFLKVVGYGRNQNREFVVIVEQHYCEGRKASEQERVSFMHALGFDDAGADYGMHLNYRTNELYVGDLNEYNVILGDVGIYVIDADCRLNTPTMGCGGSYLIPQPNLDFSRPCALARE